MHLCNVWVWCEAHPKWVGGSGYWTGKLVENSLALPTCLQLQTWTPNTQNCLWQWCYKRWMSSCVQEHWCKSGKAWVFEGMWYSNLYSTPCTVAHLGHISSQWSQCTLKQRKRWSREANVFLCSKTCVLPTSTSIIEFGSIQQTLDEWQFWHHLFLVRLESGAWLQSEHFSLSCEWKKIMFLLDTLEET